jgi:hypothetical protein
VQKGLSPPIYTKPDAKFSLPEIWAHTAEVCI